MIRNYVKNTKEVHSNIFAAEICNQLGFSRIISSDDPIDKKMNWKQVSEASKSDFLTIGGHSHTHQILRTLYGISLFQDVCASKGIVSKCFLWKKVFNTKTQSAINNNEELRFWYQKINWDNFWFHKERLGLAEWGIDNGYTGDLNEDKINNPPQGWYINDDTGEKEMVGHPSTQCHMQFALQVVKKWLEA